MMRGRGWSFGVLTAAAFAAMGSAALAQIPPNAKSRVGRAYSAPATDSHRPDATVITEGLEGGVMPPTGWTRQVLNASYTWIVDNGTPHSGAWAAYVPWNYGHDEWLISPEFTISSGTLTAWSQGSIYWCRDTNNNCDLEAWLIVGAVGGTDDILVGNLEAVWPANFTWAQSTFNLTPLLPGGPIRLAFRLHGNDDADVYLDDILLDGVIDLIFKDGFQTPA